MTSKINKLRAVCFFEREPVALLRAPVHVACRFPCEFGHHAVGQEPLAPLQHHRARKRHRIVGDAGHAGKRLVDQHVLDRCEVGGKLLPVAIVFALRVGEMSAGFEQPFEFVKGVLRSPQFLRLLLSLVLLQDQVRCLDVDRVLDSVLVFLAQLAHALDQQLRREPFVEHGGGIVGARRVVDLEIAMAAFATAKLLVLQLLVQRSHVKDRADVIEPGTVGSLLAVCRKVLGRAIELRTEGVVVNEGMGEIAGVSDRAVVYRALIAVEAKFAVLTTVAVHAKDHRVAAGLTIRHRQKIGAAARGARHEHLDADMGEMAVALRRKGEFGHFAECLAVGRQQGEDGHDHRALALAVRDVHCGAQAAKIEYLMRPERAPQIAGGTALAVQEIRDLNLLDERHRPPRCWFGFRP